MNLLFKKDLKRLDLLKIKSKDSNEKIKISVYRNHSFESIASVLNAFLDFSDITADFIYSDYDDSLNFEVKKSDLNIIWLDLERYKNIDLSAFLTERLLFLREKVNKPILLLYSGNKIELETASIPDCFAIWINDIIAPLGENAYDIEKEPYSGTRLSNKSALLIAQKLGLQILPAIFKPALKALVFDLDNTLYHGILGEDGIDGISLTEAHKKLQCYIKNLKNKGFFICLASKNEEEDAKTLFEQRQDFPLKWEDFAAVKINWANKADNLKEIAKILNIGLDSMLFVDDNPAEIQNIEFSALPVKTVLAETPETVLQTLSVYPGLLKLKKNKEDDIRSKDIKANEERQIMAKNLSPEEYFAKLGIELCFSINDETQIPRVSELFNKTNQFIFNYKRYSEADVKSIMDNAVIVTVKMSDMLSDSGIIAIMAAHKEKNDLQIDELTISCRALGRNLEDIMINKLLQLAQQKLQTSKTAKINYKIGPRNRPAINWLENVINQKIENDGQIQYNIPESINTNGLQIEVKYAEPAKI